MLRVREQVRTRWLTATVLLLCAGSAAAEPRPAIDDVDTEIARRHYAAAEALYDEGRYREAVREFEAARAVKPSPPLDFNIGRAHDRLEEWAEAIAAYERYVAATPTPSDADEVRARIRVLRGRLAPAAPVAAAAAPVAVAAAPAPVAAAPAPAPVAAGSAPVAAGSAPIAAGSAPVAAGSAPVAAAPAPVAARPVAVAPASAAIIPSAAAVPVAAVPASAAAPVAVTAVSVAAAKGSPATARPARRRWWLWAALGGVVVVGAGVAIGAALYQPAIDYPTAPSDSVGRVQF